MTEAEVRERLERALRKSIFERVWSRLLDESLVQDYLDGTLEEDPKEAWRVLKEAAIKEQRYAEEIKEDASGGGVVVREEPPGGLVSVVVGLKL